VTLPKSTKGWWRAVRNTEALPEVNRTGAESERWGRPGDRWHQLWRRDVSLRDVSCTATSRRERRRIRAWHCEDPHSSHWTCGALDDRAPTRICHSTASWSSYTYSVPCDEQKSGEKLLTWTATVWAIAATKRSGHLALYERWAHSRWAPPVIPNPPNRCSHRAINNNNHSTIHSLFYSVCFTNSPIPWRQQRMEWLKSPISLNLTVSHINRLESWKLSLRLEPKDNASPV